MILEEKKDQSDGAQSRGGKSPDATNHEGETGTPSDASSGEEYSSSEESSSSEDTTPPTVVKCGGTWQEEGDRGTGGHHKNTG